MRDAFEMLISFGSFFGAWYWIASRFHRRHRLLRHLVGFSGGAISSFALVAVFLSVGIFKQPGSEVSSPELPVGVTSTAVASGEATQPQQFESVAEMIEDRADFSEENGTFKVMSTNPLHIQLAAQVVANDLPEVVLSEVQRVAIYGVYRTLIHTNVDKVRVTAVPMEVTVNPRSSRYLKSPTVDLQVNRNQALRAVAAKIPVESLSDLVDQTAYPDSWSKPFESLYYKPEERQDLVNSLAQ